MERELKVDENSRKTETKQNDNLKYELDEGSTSCAGIALPNSNECSYVTPGCLNSTHWDGLYGLAQHAEAEFVFGLAFDLSEACKFGPEFRWKWVVGGGGAGR